MSASAERPAAEPVEGPISRMVARELASIRATYDSVRAAWDARTLPKAALALAWLKEQVELHTRWEEESLFEELESRCDLHALRAVRAHHLAHEALERELDRVTQLLEQRQKSRDGLDAELEVALAGLGDLLSAHGRKELDEVCCPLDHALDSKMVETIETELAERGRIH